MDCRLNLGNIVFELSYQRNEHGQERKNNKDRRLFQSAVRNEIERRRGIVSRSTYENELTAYRSFLTFAGNYISLCDLTADLLKAHERWLLRRVCPNTAACYMRSLRAVINRLGLDGKAVFRDVRTAKDKAEKKAIGREDIRKVMDMDLKGKSFLAYARDLFIISIMLMGIPFIDLVNLRKSKSTTAASSTIGARPAERQRSIWSHA